MGHKLVGMSFVRLQCFCPALNGVTPKTIFYYNLEHSFRECGRVEGEYRDLSSAWCLIAEVLLAARAATCSADRDAQQRLLSPT